MKTPPAPQQPPAGHGGPLHLAHLQHAIAVSKAGYGGVLATGTIVDRREYPEAMKIPANSMMGVPKPKDAPPFYHVSLGDLWADNCRTCGERAEHGLATQSGPDGCAEAVTTGRVFCLEHLPPAGVAAMKAKATPPEPQMAATVVPCCQREGCGKPLLTPEDTVTLLIRQHRADPGTPAVFCKACGAEIRTDPPQQDGPCGAQHPVHPDQYVCNLQAGHPGQHCRRKDALDGAHQNVWWT